MLKYAKVAKTVARRIELGDYRLREFPSVVQLARELKINPRTVTKAVDELVEQGVLERDATGRVDVRRDPAQATLHVALLQPAFPSITFSLVQRNVTRIARARGWRVKLVSYTHWHDPTIPSVLGGFDGVFFTPLPEDVPPDVVRMLRASHAPLAVLDQDLSAEGIPSIQFHESSGVACLLDPLTELGHRDVACLNTQPNDSVIRERIEQWQFWKRLRRVQGRLLEHHVQPYHPAFERAHAVVTDLLQQNALRETAIFCTTGAAAVGAMRALADFGRVVGRDVSVCAADDHGGEARFLVPRLTCLGNPSWDPYLEVCLDWFATRGGAWVGPLCIRPASTPVYTGDSTGPAR